MKPSGIAVDHWRRKTAVSRQGRVCQVFHRCALLAEAQARSRRARRWCNSGRAGHMRREDTGRPAGSTTPPTACAQPTNDRPGTTKRAGRATPAPCAGVWGAARCGAKGLEDGLSRDTREGTRHEHQPGGWHCINLESGFHQRGSDRTPLQAKPHLGWFSPAAMNCCITIC
jgi:hypothetical protein